MTKFCVSSLTLFALVLICWPQTSLKAHPSEYPAYDIHLAVDPDAHLIEANGVMEFSPSGPERDKMVISFFEKATDVKFEQITLSGQADIIRTEKLDRQGVGAGLKRWLLYLPHPVPAGSAAKIRFSYRIDNELDSIFYIGPEGSFASGINTAWYPEAEDADMFRLKGTGVVTIDIPAGYIGYASAATTLPSKIAGRSSVKFKVDNPIFFSFAIGKFTVSRRVVNGLPISLYVLRPRPAAQLESIIDGCGKIIQALSREFGPYPYSDFGIVEMPTQQARKGGSDGASLNGFMLGISSYFDQEFNTAFYGHEIGHSWWGNLVQKKGPAGSYLLDEAMANYGSLRAVEMIDGPDTAERYRRTGYPGYYAEYSGSVFLRRSLGGLDHTLTDLPLTDGFLSRRLANTKGMLVWDMLSRTIGRQRFSSILAGIAKRWANRKITLDEFLEAVSQGAGQDMKWFYDQWLRQKGSPDFKLEWTKNGGVVSATILQEAPFYRASIEVQASSVDGRTARRTVAVSGPTTQFTLQTPFNVKTLELDPNYLVLRWTYEYRDMAQLLLPYTRGELKLSQGQAAEAYNDFHGALASVPDPDVAGLRFFLEYGLAQSLIDQKKMEEALPHVNAALAAAIRPVDTLPWVYVQMAQIAKAMNDQPTLRRVLDLTVAADKAAGRHTGAVDQVREILTQTN